MVVFNFKSFHSSRSSSIPIHSISLIFSSSFSMSHVGLHSQCLMLVAYLEVCDIYIRTILDSIDVLYDVCIYIFLHMWNKSQIPWSVICKMLKLLCNRAIFPMYLVLDIEVDLYKICISIPLLFFIFLRIHLSIESGPYTLLIPFCNFLKVS